MRSCISGASFVIRARFVVAAWLVLGARFVLLTIFRGASVRALDVV